MRKLSQIKLNMKGGSKGDKKRLRLSLTMLFITINLRVTFVQYLIWWKFGLNQLGNQILL